MSARPRPSKEMIAEEGLDTFAGSSEDGSTLRLMWPQWHGAGTSSIRSVAPEFPLDVGTQRIRGGVGGASVSVAPFSDLAARYGDDLAILWIDPHPDIGTPAREYP